MKKGLFISTSLDPFENQSKEAYLFHKLKDYDVILMLYVNKPCVVIGRNQNPWTEVNVRAAKSKNIPVLRRLSGGGTVYHDLGNLNFSFIYNKGFSTINENFDTVISAVARLGIKLNVNDRNDLCFDKFKISGNAFYNRGKRHMHHGTLLINTDFSDLWEILRFNKEAFKTKSVASVKSDVKNLNVIKNSVSMKSVIKQLEIQHQGELIEIPDTFDEKYQTWEWIYGQTPQFTYSGENNLTVKSGKVIEIDGKPIENCKQFTLD